MMTTSSEVLYDKLCGFSRYLRKQGMQVGLTETRDCLRALEMTGFEDREAMRTVLKAVCAKSPRECEVFDQCFDAYFVSQEEFDRNARAEAEAEAMLEEQRRKADEELMFNGKPIDLRDDLKETYARMAQSERDKLQDYIERYQDNLKRSPQLYEGFIRSVFMRSLLEQQMMMEDAGEGSQGGGADLMFRDISNFRPEEIPKAYQIIDQLTRRINGEVAARKRAAGHSDKVDFRRTIRAALSSGGVMAKLRFKRKHHRKKRVIMLCDVSGSMLQFSEFAIRFIKSMADVSDHSETFLFSEYVQKVSAFALENMDMFDKNVRRSSIWGKGTNIGRALETVCAARPAVLGPSSVLLILSDAKTVDLARAEAALQRAGKLAGSVVWLCPIPESKWEYLHGISALRAHCNMIPCSTLNELARACARLM